MFLTGIWQQSAVEKAEVVAKAWIPATLLDPSEVKILLKAGRKKSASTTQMHKSLSSDEWQAGICSQTPRLPHSI